MFNPACTSEKDLQHLKFLGILFGVAIRTKKPIQLHIAPPMWKMLVGMSMTAKDLEDVSVARLVYDIIMVKQLVACLGNIAID